MRINTLRFGLPLLTLGALSMASAVAQPSNPSRMYGAAAPFQVGDLPPGQLRSSLQSLPEQARARALHWLHGFSFPGEDVTALRVDGEGGVLYEDTVLPESDAAATGEGPWPAYASEAQTFSLHSRPGATRVMFVDFDGHTISGTAWNAGAAPSYAARPYDTDGNPTAFSSGELNQIGEIWNRIAEDYAPFDVDVTTEQPAAFGPETGHILITHNGDENGLTMPYASAGGVAYVGVWGLSSYGYYSPALVYYNNLGSGWPPYVAEAAAHEMGHNLALSHDGTSTPGYYAGHGEGWVSWAPIMGVGYYTNVTQWSKGEYPDANNAQDDLAIIGEQLAYRPDDHGNDTSTASGLLIDAAGNVASSNPETDPDNLYADNKGVIETRSDLDYFVFTAGSGGLSLQVTPAWDAYYRDNHRGANLDVLATLYDAGGNVVDASDPLADTRAAVSATIAAGTYYLAVEGVGNPNTPYSDYASLGQYFITGTVPIGTPDTTPPWPDPMNWSAVPTAIGHDAISMTATTASDDSGVVQYNFSCIGGGSGCTGSGWQSSASHIASGLAAATSYSFQVSARDLSGNETQPSMVASATTDALPTIPSVPNGLVAADAYDGSAVLTWAHDGINITGFELERENRHKKRDAWVGNISLGILSGSLRSYTDLSGTGEFRYHIRALNDVGASDWSDWAAVIVTGNGGSDPKPCHGKRCG